MQVKLYFSGIADLPQLVFNQLFQRLSFDDLGSISVTCSTLNCRVRDFVQSECKPKRLEALMRRLTLLDILKPKKSTIAEPCIRFYRSLELGEELYCQLIEDDQSLKNWEYYYLLNQRRLFSNIDMELSGKWVGQIRTNNPSSFWMVLQFDRSSDIITGYIDDGAYGISGGVNGSYCLNMITINKEVGPKYYEWCPATYSGEIHGNSDVGVWKMIGDRKQNTTYRHSYEYSFPFQMLKVHEDDVWYWY